jgi:pimeloyl-ACP methyl ester carboxylesterase
MPELKLPQGTLRYQATGPDDSPYPPVVFIHGFLVDGRLWTDVAARLASDGIRCYLPDIPLGSHRVPMNPDADLSPHGLAAMIDRFVQELGLEDVTLVGNDTGGALCQFTVDAHPQRVGRLVLTNCDAFDKFPPPPFSTLVAAARYPAVTRTLLVPMRTTRLRHSPLGFGLLARSFDADLTLDWLRPAIENPAIRADIARFARGVKPADLLEVSTRLNEFKRPVKIVWGEADRVFKPEFGRRLAQAFPNSSYLGLPGSRTFVSLDAPAELAAELREFADAGTPGVTPNVSSPHGGPVQS